MSRSRDRVCVGSGRTGVPACALATALLLLILASCGGEKKTPAPWQPSDVTRHASLLAIRPLSPGATLVDVTNPWDTTQLLMSYLLLEKGAAPDSVPQRERSVVLRVPLTRSLVYSSVHASAIDEIGAAGAVAGVAEGQYFTTPFIIKGLKGGQITDVGSAMSPSVEKIAALKPDAVLLSPYQNAGHGVVEEMGVTCLDMADYMEPTPLGRAEWVKFLGLLYGQSQRADSLFAAVKSAYEQVRDSAAALPDRPLVLTEMLTDGYWFVPGGHSYQARLIEDAGARYPWAANRETGSLQLDFSAVYAAAGDADIWLTKTFGRPMTLASLRADYPLNSQFHAYKTGRVYNADTRTAPLYDDVAFHPERVLGEYAAIFHPEAFARPLRYFKKVE